MSKNFATVGKKNSLLTGKNLWQNQSQGVGGNLLRVAESEGNVTGQ